MSFTELKINVSINIKNLLREKYDSLLFEVINIFFLLNKIIFFLLGL